MRIKGDFIIREIAGDYILIPTGKTALEFNGMITMNKVGSIIWTGIQKEESKEQIIEEILGKFDIDEVTALNDFNEFVEKIKKAGFIEA